MASLSRALCITKVRGLISSVLIVALVYGRALKFGFTRFQEEKLAVAMGATDLAGVWNGLLLNLSHISPGESGFSPLWRPTVNVVYLFAGWLGEGEAWSFRLLSIFFLIGICWSARRMLGRRMGRDLVLMLIAFHPMMTAAVLDVMAMPELLLCFFAVCAVTTEGRWSFLWTLLAIGAHEAGAIIPLISMGLSWDASGKKRDDKRWIIPLSAVVCWWAMLGLLGMMGALEPQAVSIPEWGAVMGAAAQACFYLGRLVVPFSPVFARTAPEFEAPWIGLAWVAVLGVLWISIRGKIPREKPIGPGFAAGLSCIVLALLATGGVLSHVPGYGEGRLALPIVGLAWLLASRPTVRVAGWTLVPVFAALALMRVGVWADPLQLWAESHKERPRDSMVSLEYGQRLLTTEPNRTVGLMDQVLTDSADPKQRYLAHIASIQAWFDLGNERKALPHLAATADPDQEEDGWILVRRCILETRYSVDEAAYPVGTVLSPLVRVCTEAANRYPKHARLANAAGVEAAIRGDSAKALFYLQRAVEMAPTNLEYRKSFSRIPMNILGFSSDGVFSPDPAAAP